MARRIVLHESGPLVDVRGKRQDFLQDANLLSAVHRLASLEKADMASSIGRETSPDHNTCKEREREKKHKNHCYKKNRKISKTVQKKH